MLTFDDALNLNYYKKAPFTGWMNGMRFLIKREAPEEGEAILHAWVWQAPLIFELVDDGEKTDFTAPFSNEGKQAVVDWINREYESRPEFHCGRKPLTP